MSEITMALWKVLTITTLRSWVQVMLPIPIYKYINVWMPIYDASTSSIDWNFQISQQSKHPKTITWNGIRILIHEKKTASVQVKLMILIYVSKHRIIHAKFGTNLFKKKLFLLFTPTINGKQMVVTAITSIDIFDS